MNHLNWKDQIDQNTNLVQELFAKIPAQQLNVQPNIQTWSIAQNLEHLIVINESYYPILNQLHGHVYKAPFHAKFTFLVNFFGSFVLKSVEPNRRKKMKTFPIWEPINSGESHGVIERFIQHQEELKNIIEAATPLIAKNVVIHSPASKVIVYKLASAFDIIVTHESRHINQAKELLELIHS